MGLLRLYLALCVVGAHSGPMFPWSAHDAHQAVQIFYLISGFYMQMVYGQYGSPREFYASRFMRIFIPYWIILAITVVLSLFAATVHWNWIWTSLQPYFDHPLQKNGLMGLAFAATTNITLFFQDWVMFLEHDAGEYFRFTDNFRTSNSPLYQYLLIPQAWTVGVELTFYLLVPFLSKLRSRTLLAVVIASLLARILAYELLDFKRDPWEYRFFPFELALFLTGMLSHRLYRILPYRAIAFQPRNTRDYCLAGLLLALAFAAASKAVELLGASIGHHYAVLMSYFAWALAIPALFQIFGKWKHDRFIGELSYPVYLSHLLVVSITTGVLAKLGLPTEVLGPVCSAFSIVLAAILYIYIFKPLESRRHEIAKKIAGATIESHPARNVT